MEPRLCVKCGSRWLRDAFAYDEPYECPRCGASPRTYQVPGARFHDGTKVVVLRLSFLEEYILPLMMSQREILELRMEAR